MTDTELSYKILKGLPAYGEMYIPIPEGQFSEGLVVKFFQENGSEWIANFESGKSNLEFVSEIKNSNEIIVVANGVCYFINKEIKSPVKIIDNYFRRDFKKIFEYQDKFILVGNRNVAIVENSKRIIYFDNLCLDFIENERIENDSLFGTLNSFDGNGYRKTNFSIDLISSEFKENRKQQKQIKKRNTQTELKKWWQIWK